MSGAYYNEHDPVCAEWLRRLIAAGLIPDGEVDERDIRDVTPAELVRFTQCHFFAGIGIWPAALRAAGWPDDRRIWTGSCPCQPFSAAGRGDGEADERHLWPHWFHLIAVCRPPVVTGEQVASKDGLGWLDLVSADLGAAAYACSAVDICAAGFGLEWRGSAYAERLERAIRDCPDPMVARQFRGFADWADQSLGIGGFHERSRLYFVGLADSEGGGCGVGGDEARPGSGGHPDSGSDATVELADPTGELGGEGRIGAAGNESGQVERSSRLRAPSRLGDPERAGLEGHGGAGREAGHGPGTAGPVTAADVPRRLEHPDGWVASDGGLQRGGVHGFGSEVCGAGGSADGGLGGGGDTQLGPDAVDGGWPAVDWLFCRDGKWRPVEAGTFPLAHEVKGRVGSLRAYGNGLDFETAKAFAECIVELVEEERQ